MPQHDDDIIPHQDETEQVIAQETERKLKIYSASILYTPEAGHTHIGGVAYVAQAELVVCNLAIRRVASVALTVNGWNQLGLLKPELAPAAKVGFNFVGPASVGKDDGSAYVVGFGGVDTEDPDNFLVIKTFTAMDAAANNLFRFHSLRYPLADVDAAQALLATGNPV